MVAKQVIPAVEGEPEERRQLRQALAALEVLAAEIEQAQIDVQDAYQRGYQDGLQARSVAAA